MCGGIFSPSKPSVPPAPEPKQVVADANNAAAEAERKQRQQVAASQGRRSLNSPKSGATGVQDNSLAETGTLFG